MFTSLLVKVLIQFGSSVLLSFMQAGVKTLQERKDNDLDVSAETVKLILDQVTVTK